MEQHRNTNTDALVAREYEWIVKGGEELRIDQRMEQLLDVANGLFARNPSSASHRLKVPASTKVAGSVLMLSPCGMRVKCLGHSVSIWVVVKLRIAGGLFHCSQAHLLAAPQVRTYTVLSITSSLGMVEFVGGTQSLKQAIMHPSLITSEVRGSLTNTTFL